jgi:tetratricopeptide (TPR) repeat protein
MRHSTVLLAGVALLAAHCDKRPPAAPPQAVRRPAPAKLRPNAVLQVPPAEMRDAMVATYRLAPDRRFIDAFAVIDQMLRGRAGQSATATFHDGQWHVSYEGAEIGSVPEFPAYRDFIPLLTSFATNVARSAPPLNAAPLTNGDQIRSAIDSFDTAATLGALQQLNAAFRTTRSSAALSLASRALTSLLVRQLDTMQVGDALATRALAVTAAAKASSHDSVAFQEVVLAGILGYHADAESLASALPAASPLRGWATGTSDNFDHHGSADAQPLVRFLELRLYAERRDEEKWFAAVRRHPGEFGLLSTVATGLKVGHFDATINAGFIVPALAYAEVRMVAGAGPPLNQLSPASFDGDDLQAVYRIIAQAVAAAHSTIGDQFESALGATAARYAGPLFDGNDYRALYRGFFYSGLFGSGLHVLDRLANPEGARDFAAILGHPADPLASQYVQWFELLLKRQSRSIDDRQTVLELDRLDRLQQPAIVRTFQGLQERVRYDSSIDLDAARLLFRRSDGRLPHRLEAAYAARITLLDLPLFEKLYGSAVHDGGHAALESSAWLATLAGDASTLRGLVDDRSLSPNVRVTAATALLDLHAIDEKAFFQATAPILPRTRCCGELTDWAKRIQSDRAADAREVLAKWLKAHPHADALEQSDVTLAIARTYEQEGNVQKAMETLTPVMPMWKESVLVQAALYLDALGEHRQAIDLARKDVDRYPDSFEGRITLAQICWRNGLNENAAMALTTRTNTGNDWRDLGQRFIAVFKDRSDGDAFAAFDEIRRRSSPFAMGVAVRQIGHAGRFPLAFRIASLLHYGGMGQLELTTGAYKILKQWKTPAEAQTWIAQAIPPRYRNMESEIAYGAGEFPLLWTLITDPDKGDYPQEVWLLRAAAVTLSAEEREAHGKEVEEYFRTTKRTDDYTLMGKYLMGLADEKAMLSLPKAPDRRCEVAYYMAVKARGEQRFRDASDWLRVVCETQQVREGEFRWAKDRLYLWMTSGQTFDRAVKPTAVTTAEATQAP